MTVISLFSNKVTFTDVKKEIDESISVLNVLPVSAVLTLGLYLTPVQHMS